MARKLSKKQKEEKKSKKNAKKGVRKSSADVRREVFVIDEYNGKMRAKGCSSRSKGRYFDIDSSCIKQFKVGDVAVSTNCKFKNKVKLERKIGDINTPNILNFITMAEYGLSPAFSDAALAEVKGMKVPTIEDGFKDLRDLPFITIDPDTAKDFDDAVLAVKREDGNTDVYTAIAGVSHYVRPGMALYEEAKARGNTTYLSGMAVHMLPTELSEKLCSLTPNEDRASMVSKVTIDKDGNRIEGSVFPALINSKARLTYKQAQDAFECNVDDVTALVVEQGLIDDLYEASRIMRIAKERRGALEIKSTEFEIMLDDNFNPLGIREYPLYESNKVIEDFALIANNNVGLILREAAIGYISRVHPVPKNAQKLVGTFISKGVDLPEDFVIVNQRDFNEILNKIDISEEEGKVEKDEARELRELVIRSQAKAIYSIDNDLGHFGLALKDYVHFTSPIRRFSDTSIHGCVAKILNIEAGAISDKELKILKDAAENISNTERESTFAERDSKDRFKAKLLEAQVGNLFDGKIKKILDSGDVIVKINDFDARGLVPKNLFEEFKAKVLSGNIAGVNSSVIIAEGEKVEVKVLSADAFTGKIALAPVYNAVASPAVNDNVVAPKADKEAKGEIYKPFKDLDKLGVRI